MRRFYVLAIIVGLVLTIFGQAAMAQEILPDVDTSHFDQTVNDLVAPISASLNKVVFYSVPIFEGQDHSITVPLILIWLVSAGVFFTFYLGAINLRGFVHSFRVLSGRYDKPSDKGHINRFEVLSTELSGTVGLGNIAGVAVAISVGGPGATLWMILAAFFGMSTKFVEAALGVKYRHIREDHRIQGGPMYYLRDGLKEIGFPKLGACMAAFFALCCVLASMGAGNMFQVNQAYASIVSVTGGIETSYWADKGWLFGLITALLVGVVIIGGINRIARVAEVIVPFMGGIYFIACAVVIGMNYTEILSAFGVIIDSGLSLNAGLGGFLGAVIMGVQRAAFSNEAGLGTAAIAHAPTKTNQPVSEGFIGMLGPVVDTIIICTMTALVIVTSGVYESGAGMEGVALTSRAFEAHITWFPYVLSLAVSLFAFSTMLAWSYYGSKAFSFLFGERRDVEVAYRLVFCLFLIVGAMAELGPVIAFTDAMVFAMAVPNILGLYFLAPKLRKELKAYWQAYGRKV